MHLSRAIKSQCLLGFLNQMLANHASQSCYNEPIVHMDRRTGTKLPTPTQHRRALRCRSHHDSPPPLPSCLSSIETVMRTTRHFDLPGADTQSVPLNTQGSGATLQYSLVDRGVPDSTRATSLVVPHAPLPAQSPPTPAEIPSPRSSWALAQVA